MAVSAFLAIANYTFNRNVASQIVEDGSANLITYLTGLGTLQTAGKLASVTLTGTNNSVTAAQATSIAGLTNFAVGSGATLVVADAAANLLLAGNGPGLAKATSVQLTGGTIATAAQATLLAALRNFSLATGTILVVQGRSGDLLNSEYAAGIAKASLVQLTGSNTVTVAQAAALAALTNFSLSTGATLVAQGRSNDLLNSAYANGLARASSVVLSGSNTVTAVQANYLASLKNLSLFTGATLVVQDGSSDLLSSSYATGLAKATSVVLSGSNTVTAAQAARLAALTNFSLATGATLVVQGGVSDLLSSEYAAGLAKATSLQLTGSNTATLSQANALAALRNVSLAAGATLVVQGTLFGLQDKFYAAGLAKATSVQFIGSATVTVSQANTLAALRNFSVATGATLVVQAGLSDLVNRAGSVSRYSVSVPISGSPAG
ncbi:MAG: hypothetical protein NTY94_16110 [Alphaproteobacteria bacterium]|nr:hypothetical protein [Alphaproteobacteria bacterium]